MKETITIKINGEPVNTYLDERGVQRFPRNEIIRWMLNVLTTESREFGGGLNEIRLMEANGFFTREEVKQLYRMIGYSVCGYLECFEEDEIENPLWEED